MFPVPACAHQFITLLAFRSAFETLHIILYYLLSLFTREYWTVLNSPTRFYSSGGQADQTFVLSILLREISFFTRVRTHWIHHITIAAIVIAAINMSARRSYLVAIRRQSFIFPNIFSTLWRCLYVILQNDAGAFLPFLGGMQGMMPLACRAARYSSLSYPLSAIKVAPSRSGSAGYRIFAPI